MLGNEGHHGIHAGQPWTEPRELAFYTAASLLALLVDYGTYWLLAAVWGMELGSAAVVGYLVGMVVSYLLLTRAVFLQRRHAGRPAYEVLLFCLSGILGVTLTYLTVTLLNRFAGADLHSAKLAAVGVSFITVYLFRKNVVFAPSSPPPQVARAKGARDERAEDTLSQ